MKLKSLLFSSIAICFIQFGCNQKETPEQEIDEFSPKDEPQALDLTLFNISWLEGNWRDTTTWGHLQSQIIEIWQIQDSVFHGAGLNIKNIKDTIPVEELLIDLRQNPICFEAIIPGNNTKQMLRYQLKSYDSDSICFENMALDFPQKITYKKTSDTTIRATVSGNVSGTIRRQSTILFSF